MACGSRTAWRAGLWFILLPLPVWMGASLLPGDAAANGAQRIAAVFLSDARDSGPFPIVLTGAGRKRVVTAGLESFRNSRRSAAVQERIRKKCEWDRRNKYPLIRSNPKLQTQTITERSAGSPAAFGLIGDGQAHIFDLFESDDVKRVSWDLLSSPGTPSGNVTSRGVGLAASAVFAGFLYNYGAVHTRGTPARLTDLGLGVTGENVLVPPYASTCVARPIHTEGSTNPVFIRSQSGRMAAP